MLSTLGERINLKNTNVKIKLIVKNKLRTYHRFEIIIIFFITDKHISLLFQ